MNNNPFEQLATVIQNSSSIELAAQSYRQAALSPNDTSRTFFVNLGDLLAGATTPKVAKAAPVATATTGKDVAKSATTPTEDKPKGRGGRPPGSKNKPKDAPKSEHVEDDYSDIEVEFRPSPDDDADTRSMKMEFIEEFRADEANKMSDEEAQDMANIVAESEEDTAPPADNF